MHYDHKAIEEKWRKEWRERKTYRVTEDPARPKYYVLDMFPYPSGAGLHVGHPLGYIASDIVARWKRHQGFCVLHPMGYDAFGLPAEQYAIQTGQHPAVTTATNIERYREQLDRIGFSFDREREVRTSDPSFYKWTQWIFLQLFESWYDPRKDKAEPIATLIEHFELQGYEGAQDPILTGDIEEEVRPFTAEEWKGFDDRKKQEILQNFRLAYLSEAWVNWCPALGTVLANDEVKDGVSERGGHPVERKRMPQWSLRITAYAQRLLDGLDKLDWSESIKTAQRNWIGRSEGALVRFALADLTPCPSPKERGEMPDPPTDARYDTINRKLYPELKHRAKEMRRVPTDAEGILWQELRNSKLGDKFRRQHSIQDFIVDFVCMDRRLIVEVDGSIHDRQKDYDAYRTQQLNYHGFKVIRFTNQDVLKDRSTVLERIKAELQARPLKPWKQEIAERPGSGNVSGSAPLSTGEGPGVRSHSSPLSSGEGQGVRPHIEVFTTRPDTLFGVTFITLAPEHELVDRIVTADRKEEVMAYVNSAKNRSERERQADVKRVSGVFTGAYCIHPFTGEEIPIWVGDYVLSGYGTGAVMAVPGGDQRDWNFAKHFGLPIIAVTEGADIDQGADERKDAKLINSGFLNGLDVPEAITAAIDQLEELDAGERRINYRLRDAAFGRQRYWGEPIPIYYKDGVPYPVKEEHLPLVLPEIDKFQPTETGEPPLARAKDWNYSPLFGRGAGGEGNFPLETTTMPGWAGSSWYFLRYMDPKNSDRFASEDKVDYWKQVDLYVGGAEHATGHLLYFRFWTKFLFDRGWIPFDEPAQRLVNQGMIQGVSALAKASKSRSNSSGEIDSEDGWRIITDSGEIREVPIFPDLTRYFFSADMAKVIAANSNFGSPEGQTEVHLDVNCIDNQIVDFDEFLKRENRADILDGAFITWDGYWHKGEWNEFLNVQKFHEDGSSEFTSRGSREFRVNAEVEKMSKSKFNVVNPDEIIEKYGADTLRLYEMFLGPIEQSKPWDTNGIEGTFRFLRKFWNLFHENDVFRVSDESPTRSELKVLHATIKKVSDDIDRMSFNTSVSQFMIAANQLGDLKCNKRAILEPLTILLAPFAPHIAEELWQLLGHNESITIAPWPVFNAEYLVEDSFSYPISFNGKTRMQLEFPIAFTKEELEAAVLANPEVQQRLEGKPPKKVIVVPRRIVNIVV